MKTLGIRLEDELHAQLSVLAQLAETSITDEIRLAIERHVETRRTDPELTLRAQAVRDEIEREAQLRQNAIATLFGTTEQASGESRPSSKRTPKNGEPPAVA
ncbi:MAG: DNA-binding protein [Thermoleophilia bacterium]